MDKNSKKRGRKPKGGKIIETQPNEIVEQPVLVQNIILHLKCWTKDLAPEVAADQTVEPYSEDTTFADVPPASPDESVHTKLRELSTRMHCNDVVKRSCCFWCTCDFDTATVFIPQTKAPDGQFRVYGSFCCPECAAAYLFSETRLDYAVRFERYHLLNFLYSKVYGYTKNIVPAPPPFYLLDKFYGSLTIDEYRTIVRGTSAIVVLDKPICLNFPEIGETNTTVAPNDTTDKTAGYRLCRKRSKT